MYIMYLWQLNTITRLFIVLHSKCLVTTYNFIHWLVSIYTYIYIYIYIKRIRLWAVLYALIYILNEEDINFGQCYMLRFMSSPAHPVLVVNGKWTRLAVELRLSLSTEFPPPPLQYYIVSAAYRLVKIIDRTEWFFSLRTYVWNFI